MTRAMGAIKRHGPGFSHYRANAVDDVVPGGACPFEAVIFADAGVREEE